MPSINVKEAVNAAKKTLRDLFDDEPLKALALEEIALIKYSEHACRAVTLGFYRSKNVNVTQPNAPICGKLLGCCDHNQPSSH